MSHEPVRHGDTLIFPASLDPQAVDVVKRLNEAGLESYFVGGCVRDLMLGLIPKDFDVSTEARPRQIRRLFRNSRVIGRRFKLVHVHFGGKIIEVATFRRTPDGSGDAGTESGDLLITRDNEFGTAEEDVIRRDFTINALLYDVRTDEVIDYVGGVADLRGRVLRTIGDPGVRLAEDPVRMLRAVKFMSRLELTPAPDLDAALRESSHLIERSSPPRVLEEIFKLLTCGRAERALPALIDYGLLEPLLPDIAGYWSERAESLAAAGRALDLLDRGRRRLSNSLLLATLYLQPWRQLLDAEPAPDPVSAARELVAPAAQRMSISRRDVSAMRQDLMNQLRFDPQRRSRRLRVREFLRRSSTQEAVDLLHIAARAGWVDEELHAEWAERRLTALADQPSRPPEAETSRRPRRRGKRGGRRRRARPKTRRSGAGKAAPADAEPAAEPAEEVTAKTASPSKKRSSRRSVKKAASKKPASTQRSSRGGRRSRRRGKDGEEPSLEPVRERGAEGGPERHPEDVEDLFDW
jgi:poly(A) polymerase